MVKAEELPSELRDEIFSFVASDLHSIPNLALVHKRVNESTVELTSDTQLKKFMQLHRPKVTTLTILSTSRISLLVDVPQKCPNVRKLALSVAPTPYHKTFWDSFERLQLQVFSIHYTYNFGVGMEPDNNNRAPILKHLTHLNCEGFTPWGDPFFCPISPSSYPNLTHVSFNVESGDSPTNIVLVIETWLKVPGLKRLILSSISGEGRIVDPRVVCLQMPSPSLFSNEDRFEFLSQVWALGEEEMGKRKGNWEEAAVVRADPWKGLGGQALKSKRPVLKVADWWGEDGREPEINVFCLGPLPTMPKHKWSRNMEPSNSWNKGQGDDKLQEWLSSA
ncbi:hypothetical protein BDP27DRAFT_1409926 [Rhodocollybia butyracea]|uniref:Uncharacterized protein n=1 Tax=Rhodocollybia butyracea TaxID=206335 RepID=A0A9P5P5W7_9AGAR|nr:hypothetical protein BDP27DRAFT_1409926 [Rhodocollybia butyracea]